MLPDTAQVFTEAAAIQMHSHGETMTNTQSCLKLTCNYGAIKEHKKMSRIIYLNYFLWEWVEIVALPAKLWHQDQDFTRNLHRWDFSE